ncbi:unnamed protein product [Coregonus sp. 'balchen']|nr:unnamed protein product [Coregonus sp. 'balchen']
MISKSRGMEDFQLDGEALTCIAMRTQDHYQVKLGINSDLGCTVSHCHMTLVEESLTAEFVQDLSITLQPVTVALTLPS